MANREDHRDGVYFAKPAEEVTWYQEVPASRRETHQAPWGGQQPFSYALLRREASPSSGETCDLRPVVSDVR